MTRTRMHTEDTTMSDVHRCEFPGCRTATLKPFCKRHAPGAGWWSVAARAHVVEPQDEHDGREDTEGAT